MILTSEAPRPADLEGAGAPTCRKWFSLEQALDYAGLPLDVIVHWTRIGRLKVHLADDGRPRIDQVELDRCLASLEWLPTEPGR